VTSPEIHTLTGAYAIDALDEFERRQFQEHLTHCPDCVREVGELRATGARLGAAVAGQPPESLRRRVLTEVAVTRQDSPAGRLAEAGTAAGAEGRWRVRLTAMAAAVATAAAVAFGVIAVRTGHERDAAETQLAQMQARYAQVEQLAAAPDARSGSGVGARGGTAFVLVSQQLNRAVLIVSDLPVAPPGHTYQAWVIGHGHPRSVGLIGGGTTGEAAPLQISGLGDAVKVGVTVEPTGGSPQPTTTPVMLMDLPA
jgi:anti-sigma-K factor RskA